MHALYHYCPLILRGFVNGASQSHLWICVLLCSWARNLQLRWALGRPGPRASLASPSLSMHGFGFRSSLLSSPISKEEVIRGWPHSTWWSSHRSIPHLDPHLTELPYISLACFLFPLPPSRLATVTLHWSHGPLQEFGHYFHIASECTQVFCFPDWCTFACHYMQTITIRSHLDFISLCVSLTF